MKKTFGCLWVVTVLLFGMFSKTAAAPPEALSVSAEDLAAAGITGAEAVPPAGERFQPPVRYFRIAEAVPEREAKKACGDCRNLLAVYAATAARGAPAWATEPKSQFVQIGGRLQVRAYIARTKRIVIVTAPSEATARKVSAFLVTKWSN